MALLATACSKGKTTEKLRDTERETLTLAMRVNVPDRSRPPRPGRCAQKTKTA